MDLLTIILIVVGLILLTGFVILLWLLTKPKKDPTYYQHLLTLAEKIYKIKNYRKAKGIYAKVIKQGLRLKEPVPQINAAIGDAYIGIGTIEFNANRKVEATQAFLSAVNYRPLTPQWIEFVAVELSKKQELSDQAITIYTSYLEIKKGQPGIEKEPVIQFLKNYYTNLIQSTAQADVYQRAIVIGKRLLSSDPRLEWIVYALAMCEWRLGNWQTALKTFQEAFGLNPQRAETPFYMGILYGKSGDRESAEKSFRKSLEIKPGQPEVLYQLSKAILAEYPDISNADPISLTEVKDYLEEACQISPNQADYWYLLGQVAKVLKEESLAEKSFTQAAQLAPNKYEYQFTIARLLYGKGLKDQAIPFYQRCLAVNPSHFEANSDLADIFLEKQNYKDAETLYRRSLTIQPENDLCQIGLGECLFCQNRWNEAIPVLVKVKSHSSKSLMQLGRSYNLAQQFVQAIDVYNKHLSLFGPTVKVYYYLALSQYHQQNYTDSVKAYEAILDQDLEDLFRRDVFFHAAQAYEKQGNFHLAFEVCNLAVQSAPEDTAILYGRGKILVGLHRWKEASIDFEEASKREPGNLLPYLGMGLVNEKEKDFQKAESAYRSALRIQPGNREVKRRLGITLAKMERWTEALGILNEFSTNPIPESQFYLAVSHTGLKMYNPALQIWQRLFSQYPKTLIYRQGYTYTEFILGVMSFQEGNFIEAIHHWEACKLVSPEVSEIQECLAEAYFRQGIFLLIQGFLDSEIKESEKYFYKAQELIPDDIRLPFYIGIYTLAKGDSETAISIFESLAGKNAFSGREYLYLAASHLQKGQLQEAKENLRLANSINDKDLPAYAFLSGCIASVENQWEVAFSEYKKVLLPSATLPTN